jgi:hypothetical protein
LHFDRFENFFHVVVILVIELGTNIDFVVAKTNEFAFHSIYALKWVKVKSITVIDIPEANILPKLTCKKNRCKH